MRLPKSDMTDAGKRIAIMELAGVAKRWQGRSVISDVNLKLMQGDFMAITGPNGGGKTTMLRILLKLLRPDVGKVIYRSPDTGEETARLDIGYLPQKTSIDSHFPLTVDEVIMSGLYGCDMNEAGKMERLEAVLQAVGLKDHFRKPIGSLSGGQMQRTLLGRAIISRPRVLVLDEPLSYVDKYMEGRIYELMDDMRRDTTIVLVSHEMTHIAAMANRHIIVDGTVHTCPHAHHAADSFCPGER